MKWEMEIEEVEAVLEKIWDIHDKLSDAIHSISRSHFLNSVKTLRGSAEFINKGSNNGNGGGLGFGFHEKNHHSHSKENGFVYVKDLPVEKDDESAIHEAKSLNAIRSALENLEDQLEFFHTIQTQQRTERDAAIARLEQSRILLALRLAEHQGKKYKVIEEARAFVGEVYNHAKFASDENDYESNEQKRSNILVRVLISSFSFAKNSLKVDNLGGILGNAAVFAVSMLAFLHLNQISDRERYTLDLPQTREHTRNLTRVSSPKGPSSSDLDVLLGRG